MVPGGQILHRLEHGGQILKLNVVHARPTPFWVTVQRAQKNLRTPKRNTTKYFQTIVTRMTKIFQHIPTTANMSVMLR